ncbi:carbamate kinase [Clostridium sp. TM06-18]|nr:carbamate kinase [Clostridium sp. TM06-18]RHU37572.1 carbamate kinase [Clostridium sp. TM06-18]
MAKKRIVMAIGHKDMGTNLPEQKEAVKRTAKVIADFIQDGWQVAIVHSNAPQVGMIHTAMNEFGKQHDGYSSAPMSVCSAMSQGYIGYDLQNGIRAELIKRGIYKPVSTVLTQVTVDPYDEAFYTPVKVVGRVMSEEEAKEEEAKGNHVKAVEGGFRRIVASPHPVAIVEIDAIKALMDADQIVIACGGGGIPVMEQGYNLRGASAIIEKDLATGLLAKEIDADVMMILTSVDNVTLNFETDKEEPIHHMTIDEAKAYMDQEQFEFASMLPKVSASVNFLEAGKGRKAIITSLDKAEESLTGEAGTTIE